MNALQSYQFQSHQLRTIYDENGELLFIAKDVCDILGYGNAARTINDLCRKDGIRKTYIPTLSANYTLIDEGNLYRLIIKSNKPESQPFESWVCDEVLPSIRKTGGYSAHPALPDFNNPVEAARAWADEAEQKQLAKAERDQALLQIESQKQTLQHKDDLIKVSNEASVKAGEILIREFVKSQDLVDMGEKQFFAWMRGQKIVFSDHNEPYQHYVKAGYFTYKPSEELHGGKFRYTMRVTPRGKVWLAAKYMAYLDAANIAVLDGEPQPRNGLVLLQGAQA